MKDIISRLGVRPCIGVTTLTVWMCVSCCPGSLEELVSSYKKVLLDKEEQIQQLEERESALQKEVRPPPSTHTYLIFDFSSNK